MVTRAETDRRRPTPFDLFRVVGHFWSSEVNRAAVDELALRAGERVLDLGAGLGPATFHAARRVGAAGTVTAIEPSRLMRSVMHVRRRFQPERRRIRICDAVAEALPVADHSIDAAVALNVVHLLTEVDRVAEELARVTGAGGRILFVEEDLDDPGHMFHQPTPHSPDGPGLDELAAALDGVGFHVASAHHQRFGGQPANTISAGTIAIAGR